MYVDAEEGLLRLQSSFMFLLPVPVAFDAALGPVSSSRQCPGTTIDRNFEVGTSLSVSFVVDGPSSLTAVCNDSAWNTDPNLGSGSVESSDAKSAHGLTAAEGPRRGRLLLDDEANGTLFQTFCNNDDDEDVLDVGWRWGAGGATFALGELSRIRLASDALLDGLWVPVREGYSTANEEGEITASVEMFESRAIYSALIFYDDVVAVQERSATDIFTRKSKLGAEGIPSSYVQELM